MKTPPSQSEDPELKREWQSWIDTPARLSADDAADRVFRRISKRRTRGVRNMMAVPAAAVVLMVITSVYLYFPRNPELPVSINNAQETDRLPGVDGAFDQLAGVVSNPAPSAHDMVIMWLDEKTPLYMALTPPSKGGEDYHETI